MKFASLNLKEGAPPCGLPASVALLFSFRSPPPPSPCVLVQLCLVLSSPPHPSATPPSLPQHFPHHRCQHLMDLPRGRGLPSLGCKFHRGLWFHYLGSGCPLYFYREFRGNQNRNQYLPHPAHLVKSSSCFQKAVPLPWEARGLGL